MEKERGKRKIESLFGLGAIPKENVRRISTYKPNLDQIGLLHGYCTCYTLHSTSSEAAALLASSTPRDYRTHDPSSCLPHILPRSSLATLSYTKPRVQ